MNKENKIYYKIAREIDNKLYSFSVNGEAKVEYKVNKWVKAPEWLRKQNYHLLVFDNLNRCMNFSKTIDGIFKIYKCKIKGKIKKLPKRARILYIEAGKIRTDILCVWPIGTVMAKKVMLLEEDKII